MALHQPLRSGTKADRNKSPVTGAREIPDKLYFRIGEVAKLCGVAPYVLRFWESEFPQLKPNKGGTGQRLYRRRDVEMAIRVKTLLHDEGYTIVGARQHLKTGLRATQHPSVVVSEASPSVGSAPEALVVAPAPSGNTQKLHKLRAEMQSLLAMLAHPPADSITHSTAPAPKPASKPASKTAHVQSIRAVKPRPVASRPIAPRPDFASLFDNLE